MNILNRFKEHLNCDCCLSQFTFCLTDRLQTTGGNTGLSLCLMSLCLMSVGEVIGMRAGTKPTSCQRNSDDCAILHAIELLVF